MKVFLLRHAPAEYGGPDPERPLSGQGRRMAEQLARFIRSKRYYKINEIWCSPYRRARETAEPFLASGSRKRELHLLDCLTPDGDPVDVVPRLARQKGAVMIVGHNPHLSHLARYLLGVDETATHLPFKKGALFVFKRDPLCPSGFSLSAYLPPAALGLKG